MSRCVQGSIRDLKMDVGKLKDKKIGEIKLSDWRRAGC